MPSFIISFLKEVLFFLTFYIYYTKNYLENQKRPPHGSLASFPCGGMYGIIQKEFWRSVVAALPTVCGFAFG